MKLVTLIFSHLGFLKNLYTLSQNVIVRPGNLWKIDQNGLINNDKRPGPVLPVIQLRPS